MSGQPSGNRCRGGEMSDLRERIAAIAEGYFRYLESDVYYPAGCSGEALADRLIAELALDIHVGRINHIRDMCQHYAAEPNANGGERKWLAQSVLNILGGNIDEQIREAISQAE